MEKDPKNIEFDSEDEILENTSEEKPENYDQNCEYDNWFLDYSI